MDESSFTSAILTSIIIILVLAIGVYVVYSLLLNACHKLKYGNGTFLSWIPVARNFILGKVYFNETGGYIFLGLEVLSLLSGFMSTTSSSVSVVSTILKMYSGLVTILQLGIIIEYFILKSRANSTVQVVPPVKNYNYSQANTANVQYQTPQNMNYSFCPKCSTPVTPDYVYCPKCWTNLKNVQPVMPQQSVPQPQMPQQYQQPQQMPQLATVYCPNCGIPVTTDNNFCTACGTTLIK